MTYLERYLHGECEPVWEELTALGADVFTELVYSEALAVVRETMRRVRNDIMTLIAHLTELGYSFGYNHLLEMSLKNSLHNAEPDTSWRNQIWSDYYDTLLWIQKQPPLFLPARLGVEEVGQRRLAWPGMPEGDEFEKLIALTDEEQAAMPDMAQNVQELERIVGRLPMALRVWYEEVGAVNMYGYYSPWVDYSALLYPDFSRFSQERYLMEHCDPLQVCTLDARKLEYVRWWSERDQGILSRYDFADDCCFKNYTGGGGTYGIDLTKPGIDGKELGLLETSFVGYLRKSILRWGGFPGM